jgi:hypothetical protein
VEDPACAAPAERGASLLTNTPVLTGRLRRTRLWRSRTRAPSGRAACRRITGGTGRGRGGREPATTPTAGATTPAAGPPVRAIAYRSGLVKPSNDERTASAHATATDVSAAAAAAITDARVPRLGAPDPLPRTGGAGAFSTSWISPECSDQKASGANGGIGSSRASGPAEPDALPSSPGAAGRAADSSPGSPRIDARPTGTSSSRGPIQSPGNGTTLLSCGRSPLPSSVVRSSVATAPICLMPAVAFLVLSQGYYTALVRPT